jgi:hypothetical protein
MAHCPSCGHENPDGARVCAQCGRALTFVSFEGQPPDPSERPAQSTGAGAELPPPPFQAPGAMPPPPAPGPYSGMRPMSPPPPLPFPEPPLTTGQMTGRYFIGIGLGFAPVLILVALALGTGAIGGGVGNALGAAFPLVPCLLGIGFLGLMIYFFTQERFRPIGYGMLTVLVALPVIAAVGCVVILSNSSF